jgi:hypothetical protein
MAGFNNQQNYHSGSNSSIQPSFNNINENLEGNLDVEEEGYEGMIGDDDIDEI